MNDIQLLIISGFGIVTVIFILAEILGDHKMSDAQTIINKAIEMGRKSKNPMVLYKYHPQLKIDAKEFLLRMPVYRDGITNLPKEIDSMYFHDFDNNGGYTLCEIANIAFVMMVTGVGIKVQNEKM
jgi:hypothetical protein